MKSHLRNIYTDEGFEFAINGQEAIDKVKQIIKDKIQEALLKSTLDWGTKVVLKPITGMMLDLNLPKKNGIQVV